jgi:hypothetical protein
MDTGELFAAIGRIRRAMPRNADVLAICEALERALFLPGSDPLRPGAVRLPRSGAMKIQALTHASHASCCGYSDVQGTLEARACRGRRRPA